MNSEKEDEKKDGKKREAAKESAARLALPVAISELTLEQARAGLDRVMRAIEARENAVIFGKIKAKRVDRLAQLREKLSLKQADSWGKLGRIHRDAFNSISESELAENRRILRKAQKLVADAVKGKRFAGRAEFISEMRKTLGFPTTHDHGLDFDMRELSTDRRLRLIYDTQFTRARAQLQRQSDIAQGVFELFPSQELIRRESRKQPRDWKKRWRDAGGKFFDGGRMIAPVISDIWARISRWNNPLPPYDYNSGMGIARVSRADSERLGVMAKGVSGGV